MYHRKRDHPSPFQSHGYDISMLVSPPLSYSTCKHYYFLIILHNLKHVGSHRSFHGRRCSSFSCSCWYQTQLRVRVSLPPGLYYFDRKRVNNFNRPATGKIENEEIRKYVNKYLDIGEWVIDSSVVFMNNSSYFERK